MRRNTLTARLARVGCAALLTSVIAASPALATTTTVVRLATSDTTVRWDISPGAGPTVLNLQRLLCDGLYDTPSTSTVPIPAIAADDGVWGSHSVTFAIRPGLRFSDGSPVTAQDVQASFRRLLTFDQSDGMNPYYLDVVPGALDFVWSGGPMPAITAPDASHITIPLSVIDRSFTELLAWGSSCIVKANASLSHGTLPPLTTGPYMVSGVSNAQVKLERNPYWGGLDGNASVLGRSAELGTSWQPDQFTVDVGVPLATQRTRIQAGTLDGSLDLVHDPAAGSGFAGRVARTGDGTVLFVHLNTRQGPLKNRNLRRALAYAVDRTKLLRVAKAADVIGATAWSNLLPPALGPAGPFALTANRAKARAAIKAAHLKKLPKIVYVYDKTSRIQAATAKEFKAEMKAVGLTIVTTGSLDPYAVMNNAAKWSIAQDSWYPDFPDASEVLRQELSYSGAYDWSGYQGLDTRLAGIAAMALGPARESKAKALATTVLRDDAPLIALRTYWTISFWSSHLTNVVYTPGIGIRWELVGVTP